MIKKFEFKDTSLILEFNDYQFKVNTDDPELLETVDNFGKEANEKAAKIKSEKDYIPALKETIQFCVDTIDLILGEGASEKIFEGRKVGLFDALNVINYINTEIKNNMNENFNAYSPNRAQRINNKNK